MLKPNAAVALVAFILAIDAIKVSSESPFKEDTKKCHPDCSKYGNCNGETGQCDCPFGLAGPACTDRLLPACHSSPANGTLPHYGNWYPKNCECIKQLSAHGCDARRIKKANPCMYTLVNAKDVLCYRYRDRPVSEQLSDSPALADPGVDWFRVEAQPVWKEKALKPDEVPKELQLRDTGVWLPLSECPNRCSEQGWCQRGGHTFDFNHRGPNEIWCQCHGYFSGESCEIADPVHCYRNCSGVGTCRGGWCHCQEGYWGHGCTRTKAYTSSSGWRPNYAAKKIYVVDLPENIAHRIERDDRWSFIDMMYSAELQFTEALLSDWAVRTENPWEAALFYVPTWSYWYSGNVYDPMQVMERATRWLQETSPFFNATGGRNHVMWATNDRGACFMENADDELQSIIKLVHFGQSPKRPYAHVSSMDRAASGHRGHGGTNIAELVQQALRLVGPLPLPGNRFRDFPEFKHWDVMLEHQMCFRPEKDIATPNYLPTDFTKPLNYYRVWDVTFGADGSRESVQRRAGDREARTTTMFFAGYNKPDMAYSQGVRQVIHQMFGPGGKYDPKGPNNRTDWAIGPPIWMAVDQMQRAKFCLAPMGFGWGIRLAEAMVTGCVPVIVQDHVYQPHWDLLPFEDFSIRLRRVDLPSIVDIIDAVTPEQLTRLQDGVELWHRAFMWDVEWGGLAYNYTITALKRRAISLWSENYRRRRRSSRRHSR